MYDVTFLKLKIKGRNKNERIKITATVWFSQQKGNPNHR